MNLPTYLTLGRICLVPLVVGSLGGDEEVRAVAAQLAPLVTGRDLVVASSDFTHYGRNFGYVPFRDTIREGLDRLMTEAARAIAAPDLAAAEGELEGAAGRVGRGRRGGAVLPRHFHPQAFFGSERVHQFIHRRSSVSHRSARARSRISLWRSRAPLGNVLGCSGNPW